MNKTFSTEADIKKIKSPKQGYDLYIDDKQEGLYLKVTAKGTKTFVVRFQNSSRQTLAKVDSLELLKARKRTYKLRQAYSDKNQELDYKRSSNKKTSKATFHDMATKYLEVTKHDNRPSSLEASKRLLNNHILHEFGDRKPWLITSRDISAFFESIRGKEHTYSYISMLDGVEVKKIDSQKFSYWLEQLGYITDEEIDVSSVNSTNLSAHLMLYADKFKVQTYIQEKGRCYKKKTITTQGTVNKCKALLSHMYNTARTWQGSEWEKIISNPCTGIKAAQSKSKTRYLSQDELKRLFVVLNDDEYKNHQTSYIIKLLIFTGARKSELINARWEHIDFKTKMWNKPDKISKTKLAPPVPLSDDAISLLVEMKSISSAGYLFKSSKDPSKPIDNCRKSFNSIMKKAEIENCTFHDLRRTFGSQLLLAGVDIFTVSKLLGHNSVATTERHYAFLDRQTLHSATNALSKVIS
ncbi:MAG: tyrosine-type recombinase/integrase [Proteobacteria bacterium]|nr:tyrosine-type recombinase/integrase [Pseudomonadota bacterium]